MNANPPALVTTAPAPTWRRASSLFLRAAWLLALAAPVAAWLVVIRLFERPAGFVTSPFGAEVMAMLKDDRALAIATVGGTVALSLIVAVLLLKWADATWAGALVILGGLAPWAATLGLKGLDHARHQEAIAHVPFGKKAGMVAAFAQDATSQVQLAAALSAVMLAVIGLGVGLRSRAHGESRRRSVWLLTGVLPVVAATAAGGLFEGPVSLPIICAAACLVLGLVASYLRGCAPSVPALLVGALAFVPAVAVLDAQRTFYWWLIRSTQWEEDIPAITEDWIAATDGLEVVGAVSAAAVLVVLVGAAVVSIRHARSKLLQLGFAVVVGAAVVYAGQQLTADRIAFYGTVHQAEQARLR